MKLLTDSISFGISFPKCIIILKEKYVKAVGAIVVGATLQLNQGANELHMPLNSAVHSATCVQF